MPASSLDVPARDRESSLSKSSLFDTRRLSELIGFLLCVAGLLCALSLVSYLPRDPSFHTSAPPGTVVHNWIGLVGSHGADLLFQGFGWVACLLPLTFFVIGTCLLLGRPVGAPWAKAIGIAMLIGSLAVLLDMFPYTPASVV